MEKVYILLEIDNFTGQSTILQTKMTMEECNDYLTEYIRKNSILIGGYHYSIIACQLDGPPISSHTVYKEGLLKLIGKKDIYD